MTIRALLMASVAAVVMSGCGGDKDTAPTETPSSIRAAKLDSVSPLDTPFKLKGAKPIDADAFLAALHPDSTPEYDSAAFDGKIGATVITGLRYIDEATGDGVVIDRVELYGADVDALNRVNKEVEAGADAPLETLFEKVRLFGIRPVSTEETETKVEIAAAEIDKLQIRRGLGAGEVENAAQLFNGFDLAGLYIKDLEVITTEDNAGVALSLPDFRLAGFGGGKLNTIIANDFTYQFTQSGEAMDGLKEALGPQGEALINSPIGSMLMSNATGAAVEQFVWRGIDFSKLLGFIEKDEKPPLSTENLIDYGDGVVLGARSRVNGKDYASFDETTIDIGDTVAMVPKSLRMERKGGKADFTAFAGPGDEKLLGVLQSHKLDDVTGHDLMEWAWNPKKGDATLAYDAQMKGLADYSMSFELEDVKIDAIEEIAEQEEGGEGDQLGELIKLSTFKMALKDENAISAAFGVAGLQMGGNGKALRASAPAMIRLAGMQAAQLNPRISDYIDAVADFVSSGGELTVEAKPQKATSFAVLSATGEDAPQTLPDVLNLTVTHKK